MRAPKILIATLIAMAVLSLTNIVFFPMVFPEGLPGQLQSVRTVPLRSYQMAALLVAAFIMALIYPLGYRGNKPWVEGLRFGEAVRGNHMNLRVVKTLPGRCVDAHSLKVGAGTQARVDKKATVLLENADRRHRVVADRHAQRGRR